MFSLNFPLPFYFLNCFFNYQTLRKSQTNEKKTIFLEEYEFSRKYCEKWKKHSVLIFFPDTFLQKKSWPLILSFSPSSLSRKNWEKHFLRLRRCLSLKIMFFSVFPTSATWGKTQNQRSTFFLQTCQGKKSEQNTIFLIHFCPFLDCNSLNYLYTLIFFFELFIFLF